jgi:basic amino acid/polyamine antiporter, APA family
MLNSSEFVEQQPIIHNFNFEGLGAGLVLILFTYGGYQQTINFGGDSINPQKHIPKAIFTGMLVVIGMYMLLNIAYVYALGMNGMQANTALAAALAGDVFGKAGSTIVSVLMFVSVLAFINVNIMANPRVYYAMADDGMLPARFKEVNSATQVQEFGLSFFTAAILITLFFVNSLEKTISYVMFFDAIGLSTAALSIFILRKKTAHLNGTGIYTIKWFPLVPIIFIIAYWFILVFIFIKNPFAALICIGIFVLGLIIYLINKRNRKPITTP